MDSACREMAENVRLQFWVKLVCSRRYTQIVPKWHLRGGRLPPESASPFHVCELWVFALFPVYQGSTVSYT